MPPVCVLARQGLSPEHVEHSMANVAIIKGGEQIFVDHVRASAKIDKRPSLRQQSQHLPIDEVLGGGGAREQADQDITVGKKRREPRIP